MLAAEMVRIPRERIPPTVPELRAYLRGRVDRGILRSPTRPAGSRRCSATRPGGGVAAGPERGVAAGVRDAAAGAPRDVRRSRSDRRRGGDGGDVRRDRLLRPLLPPRYRYIAPYQEWLRPARRASVGGGRRASGAERRAPPAARPAAPWAMIDGAPARHRRRPGGLVGAAARRRRGARVAARERASRSGSSRTRRRTARSGLARHAARRRLRRSSRTRSSPRSSATATYLRTHHAGATVFLLSDGDARRRPRGVELGRAGRRRRGRARRRVATSSPTATMNRVFRLLMDGAALVGMHRNLYWRTDDGLELDGGAYIAGLEEAAGTSGRDLRQARRRRSSTRRSRCSACRPSGRRWSATTS